MKKSLLPKFVIIILLSGIFYSLPAQNITEKVKGEITETLKLWNTAAKNSDTDQLISLFDNSENIMLIGSNKGEIWKGKDQIKGHLNSISPQESVSWDVYFDHSASVNPPAFTDQEKNGILVSNRIFRVKSG